MLGSKYTPNWKGKILFLEDVDESNYQIDRLMAQLQLAGVFKQIKGFIFGQCLRCAPTANSAGYGAGYGTLTIKHILDHYIQPLGIPAWMGAMIGHKPQIFTLPEGVNVKINANKGSITMLEPAVS